MNELAKTSRLLRNKISVALPLLFSEGDRIFQGENIRERYVEYIIMLHGTVRASVPLMRRAIAIAERDYPLELLSGKLCKYMEHHIPEELGHDEWLLEDLEILGVSRAVALARPPAASVAALVGSQYYWMEHYHPVSLLGYIAVMEGYPPKVERVDELVDITGLPRGAFRTLRKHAFLDPHHRDDLDDFLDELELSREHEAIVGMSALQTVSAAAEALGDVASSLREKSLSA